jgi:hypothetical protein
VNNLGYFSNGTDTKRQAIDVETIDKLELEII